MAVLNVGAKRLQGTKLERTGDSGVSVGGAWKQVAKGSLSSHATTLDVASIPNSRYLMVLYDIRDDGTNNNIHIGRVNDVTSNYDEQYDRYHGSSGSSNNGSYWNTGAGDGHYPSFGVEYLASHSSEGLIWEQCEEVSRGSTGAGNDVIKGTHKGNVGNQSYVNKINLKTDFGSRRFGSGTEVTVLGWDESNTHTENFWNQLASVDLGSAGDVLTSGTFDAHKYLWVQILLDNDGTSNNIGSDITFNDDTGSNYSWLRHLDGTNESQHNSDDSCLGTSLTGHSGNMWACNLFICNIADQEKLFMGHHVTNDGGAGAGTAPTKYSHFGGKWVNTSNQITKITATNTGNSNFSTRSYIKVFGGTPT